MSTGSFAPTLKVSSLVRARRVRSRAELAHVLHTPAYPALMQKAPIDSNAHEPPMRPKRSARDLVEFVGARKGGRQSRR
jgi:hypothetical protein